MGLWEQALATGAVFVNPYDPANIADMRRNLADSLSLEFNYTSPLADLLEPAFAQRTSAEWERFLAANGSCATIVMTWEEWQRDADARAAGVFVEIPGTENLQIGRAVWMRSALPYAPLVARRTAQALPASAAAPPTASGRAMARLPLEGYKVVDMTNVLAGPSCTRMFVELGAERDPLGRDGPATAADHPCAVVGREFGRKAQHHPGSEKSGRAGSHS